MIYFDNAATTLQKPKQVMQAVMQSLRSSASVGRGDGMASQRAGETLFACRSLAADLFSLERPEQVVFTFHATHALNIAIHSLVKPRDRVLISGYEHNAVCRPLVAVPELSIYTVDTPLWAQEACLAGFARALKRGVDVVICNHVSNVFGYILPLEGIAQLCREADVPLIVDASQSAGVLPLDMSRLGAKFVAMPGHKGLYAPQGTGILLCGMLGEPLLYGGTGSQSMEMQMPETLPDRHEAGTHNVAGIAGLLAGLRFVQARGMRRILQEECALRDFAAEGLAHCPRTEVFHSPDPSTQTGVLSFRVRGIPCEEIGAYLAGQGIAVRTGLHCAPLAHQTAGTLDTGTVRLSFSAFNTATEVQTFLRQIRHYLKQKLD